MTLIEIENLARQLMKQHHLNFWKFEFNNRKSAIGLCNEKRKTIYLSKILTPQMKYEDVKDTILHEIAHALVGIRHGHNSIWRAKAISIGCNGQRCTSEKALDIDITAKYEATCKNCGHVHKANRRKKRDSWCRCSAKGFLPENKLEYIQQY